MHKARQQRIQLLLIKCTEIKKVPCLGDAFTLWHPPVQLTNIKKKKKKKNLLQTYRQKDISTFLYIFPFLN